MRRLSTSWLRPIGEETSTMVNDGPARVAPFSGKPIVTPIANPCHVLSAGTETTVADSSRAVWEQTHADDQGTAPFLSHD